MSNTKKLSGTDLTSQGGGNGNGGTPAPAPSRLATPETGGRTRQAQEIFEAYQELGIAESDEDRDRITDALVSGGGVLASGEITIGGDTFPVVVSLTKIGRA